MMCRKRIKPDKNISEEQRGGVEDGVKIKKEKVNDREKEKGGGRKAERSRVKELQKETWVKEGRIKGKIVQEVPNSWTAG
jgi:hypothetical protein